MPFPNKKLRVFPNPWCFIDHLGRPAGRVSFDAYEGNPGFGFVGAALTDVKVVVNANTMRVAGQDLETHYAQHDHRVTYSKDAVEIQNTAYYRAAIKSGDLVAADKETAAEAGLKFVPPAEQLAKLRSDAIAAFNACTAEDAHNRFGSVDPLYTSDAAATVPASVQPALPKIVQTVVPTAPVATKDNN